ncbi:MAG: HTH-type transcriptional regulator MurR, partial [Chloroflexota bacterium]|nr:HTH-type transcriptional regulator MurR [Chloroflexota bacterium]
AQAAAIAVTRPDDLFVGLGMTVLSPNVTVFLKMARAVGARTIGIVSAMSNPVAGVAEHVLHAPANTVGLLPSLTAFTAILHGLTQAVAIARGYSMADWAVRTENYLREYKVALRTQIPNAAEIVRAYGAAPPPASQAELSGAGSDRAASRPGVSTNAPSANNARI